MKKLICFISLIICYSLYMVFFNIYYFNPKKEFSSNINKIEINQENTIEKEIEVKPVELTFSFIGDCVLGSDPRFGYGSHFNYYFNEVYNKDYSIYFSKVKHIFAEDDYTLANLENPLTTSENMWAKEFNFKGDPSYINILKAGNIEGVTIANNHIFDYGIEGYVDTKQLLINNNIDFAGWDNYIITEIKSIKVGILSFYTYYQQTLKIDDNYILDKINKIKEENIDLLIVANHFGTEGVNYTNPEQRRIAHLIIDGGADIYVGSHPHVLQGIEIYNNKYIIYSLGNFVYGGHANPKDTDTIIAQLNIIINNNQKTYDLNIIPISFTSSSIRNDYIPMILENEEKNRVISRINTYSKDLNFQYLK